MINKHKDDHAKLLASFTTSLSSQYILSDQPKEANFAFGIVQILLENTELLNHLSKHNKNELIDCLKTHTSKYTAIFKSQEAPSETALAFQTNVTNLLEQLKKDEIQQISNLNSKELTIIKELITKTVRKCQILFAEQANNQAIIDKLQALAIAFNTFDLSLRQQLQLADKLLLVRELWQISDFKLYQSDNFKLLIHTKPQEILQDFKFSNQNDAFEQIITLLVEKHNTLHELTNNKLAELYDRLKNIEQHNSFMFNLLKQIHLEAQFRYNHNRLSDSGYELLKRFQSYDTIIHQIENSEFVLAEAFLLRKNNFIHETMRSIAKHIDNIKAVGADTIQGLHNALHKINAELAKANHNQDIDLAILPSIQAKLAKNLDQHILKRYADLDKFTVIALKHKYTTLFDNINQLLDDNADSSCLKNILVRKLAQDYYINIRPNSVHKLRSMVKERDIIVEQLSEIEFLEILNQDNQNSLTRLNFRRLTPISTNKTATEYVSSIIRALVANCSAAQLEKLYKPLLKEDLSQIKMTLKQEIIQQIEQRTTISKLIYAVFVGQKHEFDKLKAIKNNLNGTLEQPIENIQ